MQHVKPPPDLISLEFKPIQEWLKKYNEYVVLGGNRKMNQFIHSAQLVILMLSVGKSITSITEKANFSNHEIETLLMNYNVSKSFDESSKRLREKVDFSIKGLNPNLNELTKFYEDFDMTVKSLGITFKPGNKLIKEIFIAKIRPISFQDVVKNECYAYHGHYPDYCSVFVRAYELLRDAKNTSTTIGWYQSVAPVKAHGVTIQNNNQVKRKLSNDQRDHSKVAKVVDKI